MLEIEYVNSYKKLAFEYNKNDTPQDRGKAFEFLTALILNVYHWDTAAPKMRKQILTGNLTDKGIDLVDLEKNIVFQVKNYENTMLGWRNISTFLAYQAFLLKETYSASLITNFNCKYCKEINCLIESNKLKHLQFDYQELFDTYLLNYKPIEEKKEEITVENRYYQIECSDLVLNNSDQKEFRLQLSCGTGKSFIMLILIQKKLKINPNFKFIIFCNTKDLCYQTLDLFNDQNIKAILVGDGNDYQKDFTLIVSTYHSNQKIPKDINFEFLIIDEAHHLENQDGKYNQEIRKLQYKQFINFSATFNKQDSIDFKYNLRQAINDNYLLDYRLYFEIFTGENYLNALVSVIKNKRVEWSPMFIYFNNTTRAKDFNQLLQQAGIKSEFISGKDDCKTRKIVKDKFELQEIEILSLCGVYNEGVSINCLKTVIFGDLRHSDINKIQISMRASRLHYSKTHYNVVFPVSEKQYFEDTDLIDLLKSFTIIDSELKYNLEHFPQAYVSFKKHNLNKNLEIEDSEFYGEEAFDSLNQKLLSSMEIKVKALLQWVDEHQKTPSTSSDETFSDGCKIGVFWDTIKQKQKIEQPPYIQLKESSILMEDYLSTQELKKSKIGKIKLTMEQKVKELLQWVDEHQKTPSFSSDETFSDGSKIGRFWSKIKVKQKIEQPPYNQLKEYYILWEDYLSTQEIKKSKIGKIKLTMEQKVKELLQWVDEHQKTPSANSDETFSDGSKIGCFWNTIKQKQKIEHPPYNQLKESSILWEDSLSNQEIKKSKIGKIKLTMEQKVKELLQWVDEHQKTPLRNDETFSDGAKIGKFWSYIKRVQKIEQPHYNQLKESSILMESYNSYLEFKKSKISN